jgi:hypothetical protein
MEKEIASGAAVVTPPRKKPKAPIFTEAFARG